MKIFTFLTKGAVSIGIIFLWMYLFNIGLGFANASNDVLVAFGFIIAVVVTIAAIMGNIFLWKKDFSTLQKS